MSMIAAFSFVTATWLGQVAIIAGGVAVGTVVGGLILGFLKGDL